MHTPEHEVVPVGQEPWQTPPEQTWPDGQALPQLPQFFASVWSETQEFPHLVVPGPHRHVPGH